MNFRWNTKCVIQGVAVAGLFLAARKGWTPEPEWWVLILLVVFTYVANAFLDEIFDCEHGDLYKTILGKKPK
jgi:fatty acid desaturase